MIFGVILGVMTSTYVETSVCIIRDNDSKRELKGVHKS
jgi:preprotein translocase subunit SecF